MMYGWKSDAEFAWGKSLYSPTAITKHDGGDRDEFLTPTEGGSTQKWSRAASCFFAQGCEAISFAILCSFAAPIVRFYQSGVGGVVLSLVGDRHGYGADAACEAIASVWGRDKGLVSTDEHIEELGNLPVLYQNFHLRDPELLRDFVRSFTDSMAPTILVAKVSYSIVDVVSSVSRDDGFRIFELKTALPKGFGIATELRRELQNNSGSAADAFLKRIVQPETVRFLKDAMPKWEAQVWETTGLGKDHIFWVKIIVCMIAASSIVRSMGLIDFSPSRIATWAMNQAKEMNTGQSVAFSPVALLNEFLQQNSRNFLVTKTATTAGRRSTPPIIRPEVLVARVEMEQGRLYVDQKCLRTWLRARDVALAEFSAHLVSSGIMIKEHHMRNMGGGTEYSARQSYVSVFDFNHPSLDEIHKTVLDSVKAL